MSPELPMTRFSDMAAIALIVFILSLGVWATCCGLDCLVPAEAHVAESQVLNCNGCFNCRVWVVVDQLEIFEGEVGDILDGWVDFHLRQWAWFP